MQPHRIKNQGFLDTTWHSRAGSSPRSRETARTASSITSSSDSVRRSKREIAPSASPSYEEENRFRGDPRLTPSPVSPTCAGQHALRRTDLYGRGMGFLPSEGERPILPAPGPGRGRGEGKRRLEGKNKKRKRGSTGTDSPSRPCTYDRL